MLLSCCALAGKKSCLLHTVHSRALTGVHALADTVHKPVPRPPTPADAPPEVVALLVPFLHPTPQEAANNLLFLYIQYHRPLGFAKFVQYTQAWALHRALLFRRLNTGVWCWQCRPGFAAWQQRRPALFYHSCADTAGVTPYADGYDIVLFDSAPYRMTGSSSKASWAARYH